MAWWPFRRAEAEAARRPGLAEAVPTRVRRLEIGARRLMDSPMLGHYDSLFRGHGIEFAEVRAYQAGDPFQSIDWKVTARMGRPYVKRFVEDRELTVLLLVDRSRSTDFGSRRRTKEELATQVASVLAFAASRSNDRLGLLLFTDRVERLVEPTRGRNHLRRVLCEMVAVQPEGTGTDLGVALNAATRHLKRRSLVFVLSDFQGPPFEQALRALARRHEVIAVQLEDPAERSLPAAGLVEIMDPESGRRRVLDLCSRRERKNLEERAEQESDRLKRMFRQTGSEHLLLRTDEDWVPDLIAFLAGRARGRRRAG